MNINETIDYAIKIAMLLTSGGAIATIAHLKAERKKANAQADSEVAEAKKAEAEAKIKETDITKNMQDIYQQSITDYEKRISTLTSFYDGIITKREEEDRKKEDKINSLSEEIKQINIRVEETERKTKRYINTIINLRAWFCDNVGCDLRTKSKYGRYIGDDETKNNYENKCSRN